MFVPHAQKMEQLRVFEPDTTIGNFEVRITTFILATCPLQFTEPSEFVRSALTQNLYLPV